jgi:phospholipid/cholesterol/gamma-HCH transport system substrate-binding protein
MNQSKSFSRSEIQSGLMVVICFSILLAMLFMASKSQLFQPAYQVDILFNYISGLTKDSPVHFAGHEVGTVKDIRFISAEDSSVMVTVTVSNDVTLKKDSKAFINVMGFMGEMFVELSAGSKDSPPLEKGEKIRGEDPVAMMEIVKQGTEILQEFEKISVSLQNLIGEMNNLVGSNKPEFESIFKNLDETSSNLRDMTADLKHSPWKLLRKN